MTHGESGGPATSARVVRDLVAHSMLAGLQVYRTVISPHLPAACRFQPSCSNYAIEAVHVHGPWRAIPLIASRLCRCRPGAPFGADPVPRRGRPEETLDGSEDTARLSTGDRGSRCLPADRSASPAHSTSY